MNSPQQGLAVEMAVPADQFLNALPALGFAHVALRHVTAR